MKFLLFYSLLMETDYWLHIRQLFNIFSNNHEPFKRHFHKMVKHTQTIRRQIADDLFECV